MAETVDDLYLYYTQRAGEISRQLCLAAVGSVWILQGALSPAEKLALNNHMPSDLRWCLFLAALSIAIDVAQYITGIALWYWIFGATEQSIKVYRGRLNVLLSFVLSKLIVMLAGFVFLAHYFIVYVL